MSQIVSPNVGVADVLDRTLRAVNDASRKDDGDQPRRAFTTAGLPNGGRRGINYDWPTIKRRYVEGVTGDREVYWPSLEEVAEHFGVVARTVREKSSVEGWVEQRRRWQIQQEVVRRRVRAEALAQAGAQIDNAALDAAQIGLQLCLATLADRARAVQRARADASAAAASASRVIDALELTRLAQAADLWHRVGLRAIGDPETHRIDLGAGVGSSVEVTTELRRDDPDRIAAVLAVLAEAGLGTAPPPSPSVLRAE